MLWLGLIASDFYRTRLGSMLEISWVPAILFYFIFLVGLTFFAIYPAAMAGSWYMAVGYGALFGFFTYATYDMTNFATLKDWPLSVVIVDILWGTVLGGFVSGMTVWLYGLLS